MLIMDAHISLGSHLLLSVELFLLPLGFWRTIKNDAFHIAVIISCGTNSPPFV